MSKGTQFAKRMPRLGKPCVVSFPVTMASDDQTPDIETHIRITSKAVFNTAGQMSFVTLGLMPQTATDLQGATISVRGGASYVVVGQTETIVDGETVVQRVTLGNG